MTLPVFLLAAGLGTRLRPLTDELPKPLLPVGDRPALAHIVARIRPVASRVVANAHHRAGELRAYLAASAPDVLVSEETRILGTAGGLARAASQLGPGPVLVWNGDILSSLDAGALVAAHAGGAAATLAVRPMPAGEGNVGIDVEGRVVRLRRESTADGVEVRGGAFLGIHVVGEALRAALPEEGCLVGDAYLPALRALGCAANLRAFEARDVDWSDIGTLKDYEAACFTWLDGRGGGSFVDEGAEVASRVDLRGSIVGRGARVGGEGVVERCIVWPGATVTAPCAAVVVTRHRVVRLG